MMEMFCYCRISASYIKKIKYLYGPQGEHNCTGCLVYDHAVIIWVNVRVFIVQKSNHEKL